MNNKIEVLDNGYVLLIESWGKGEAGVKEAGIIEAARQSTQGSFRGGSNTGAWNEADEKLLRFMYNHNHSTPFEFCGMVIEVQAPIFVFREWHRHRTQSYNEMSARYSPLPDMNYIPTKERLFLTQEKNKQAQGLKGKVLTDEEAGFWLENIEYFYKQAEELYHAGLETGIPKELARIILPVGRFSRMRATANLRNWLHFLTLRMNENAQWEIRQFANAVGELVKQEFPKTWNLFEQSLS